jgi:hypothetical protein
MNLPFRHVAFVGTLVASLLAPLDASASGEVSMQQFDGSTQSSEHVGMKLVGLTLLLSSPNHKDVLEIETDACSYPAGVERCLPYKTTLRRDGRAHVIELERGSVFVNMTDAIEHLPHSSQVLAPRHVIVHLHTVRGTYISAQGALDGVK